MMRLGRYTRDVLTEVAVRARAGRLLDAAEYGLMEPIHRLRTETFGPRPEGVNVFDQRWDVLVLLDACRGDLLRSVADEYEWLSERPPTINSVGWNSKSWMKRTFSEQYSDVIGETALVTGNPHTERVLSEEADVGLDDFGYTDLVYRWGWNDDMGTVPPDAVTNAAIRAYRTVDTPRMIIHYMQPHFPSIPSPEVGGQLEYVEGEFPWKRNVWERLKRGEVERHQVWEAYQNNLRYVLKCVEILRENLDAPTAVISADHGNSIGEYGFYGHGHHPTEGVREVPWVETSMIDKETHIPGERFDRRDTASVDEQLEALGYRL